MHVTQYGGALLHRGVVTKLPKKSAITRSLVPVVFVASSSDWLAVAVAVAVAVMDSVQDAR